MSRAEKIIVKRIKELSARMDYECVQEVEADMSGAYFDKRESFRRWSDMYSRKVELMDVLSEIRGCTLEDLVLE